MKGGNGVSAANGITHSPSGELFGFAFGKLRNFTPVGRFVTAFQSSFIYIII